MRYTVQVRESSAKGLFFAELVDDGKKIIDADGLTPLDAIEGLQNTVDWLSNIVAGERVRIRNEAKENNE